MRRLIIPFVLLAIPILTLSAELAVSGGVQQAALIVKDTRFTPGVQLLAEMEAGLSLVLSPEFRLDAGVGIGHATPSAPTIEGITYRGLTTRSVRAGISWLGNRYTGGTFGTQFTIAEYAGTSLLFFYPGLFGGPVFRMPLGKRAWVDWTLPITYHFRVDLIPPAGTGTSLAERLPLALSVGLMSRVYVVIPRPEP